MNEPPDTNLLIKKAKTEKNFKVSPKLYDEINLMLDKDRLALLLENLDLNEKEEHEEY